MQSGIWQYLPRRVINLEFHQKRELEIKNYGKNNFDGYPGARCISQYLNRRPFKCADGARADLKGAVQLENIEIHLSITKRESTENRNRLQYVSYKNVAKKTNPNT